MNQTQRKYAVERIIILTKERIQKHIDDYNHALKDNKELLIITLADFTANPPPLKEGVAHDMELSLENIYDLSNLKHIANKRFSKAMIKYNLKDFTTSRLSYYFKLINPINGKVAYSSNIPKTLAPYVNMLVNDLNKAVDFIMLGDSEQAQSIIDNY